MSRASIFVIIYHMFKHTFRSFFALVVLVAQVAVLLSPTVSLARELPAGFDYNYILADNDLFDYGSMSLEQIIAFLVIRGSTLTNYRDVTTGLLAPQIIYQISQDWQISPKFLLALLQKEQSLVENPSPSQYNYDWATGYGVCDDCSTDDALIQKFKGFYNQVYNVGRRIHNDFVPQLISYGRTITGMGTGTLKKIDGVNVTPANNATAILYTYTPHLHGNLILWSVWNKYFTRAYPDGTLLAIDGTQEVWRLENGARRKFAKLSVFLTFYNDFDKVITISKTELVKYPEGAPIKFSNYSFLKTKRGTVYLLVDNTLRGFDSREALRLVGVNPGEIIKVDEADITDYPQGAPITVSSIYPLGTLLQDKKSGGVWWVQNGVKQAIVSKEILSANFGRRRVTGVTAKQLTQYADGVPMLFPEGELVRSKTANVVYLISNKQRRSFASPEALQMLGYEMNNVVATTDEAVNMHELGEVIRESY